MKVINIRVTDKVQLTGIKEGDSILNANFPLRLAEGNYKSVILNFEFASTTWTETALKKYATFTINDKKKVKVELVAINGYTNACYVPYDVFQENCRVDIGVYGIATTGGNTSKIVSTEVVRMLVVDGSYNEKLREENDIPQSNAERVEGMLAEFTVLINSKVDKVNGKGLSTNDFTNTYKKNVDDNTTARHSHSNKAVLDGTTASYTTEEKTKLSGIEAKAQVNKIEKIIVNGVEQTITNKTVEINVSSAPTPAHTHDYIVSGTTPTSNNNKKHTIETQYTCRSEVGTCDNHTYSVTGDPVDCVFDGGVNITGGTKYTCTVCGYSYSVHRHNYVVSSSNIVSDGNKKHHTVTNYICDSTIGSCSASTKTETGASVNCTFDSGVSVSGGTKYTCTGCGYSYTQPTSPTVTGKQYGIRRLISNSSSAWERIGDSVGLQANATKDGTAVVNDFDSLYPWSDIISYNYDTTAKQIKAYYGDPTFKFDGTNGEVLTKIPQFWVKRYQEDGYEYIYISTVEAEGYTKIEQFSVGRYTMSGSSAEVHSKSGVAPLRSTTITNFRNYAKALGTDFGQLDWRYFVLQILYLVEYADYNSQSKLGYGNTNNYPNVLTSGGCDTLGMKSGCLLSDYKHSVIYRGIEDIFGNVYQFVDGINIKDYVAYICYDPSKYVVDKFDDDYSAVGYTNSSTSGSYIKELGYDSNNSLISLPKTTGGSSSTYMSDYYYCGSGNKIVYVGGYYINSSGAGLWYWSCNFTSSNSGTNIGSRLLRYQ